MATGPSTNGAEPALYNVVAALRGDWIDATVRGQQEQADAIERRYRASITGYMRRLPRDDAEAFLVDEQVRVFVEYQAARAQRGKRALWWRVALNLVPGLALGVVAVVNTLVTPYGSLARLGGVLLQFIVVVVWFIYVVVVLRRANKRFAARIGADFAHYPAVEARRIFAQADRTIYAAGVLCIVVFGYVVAANLPPGLLHR